MWCADCEQISKYFFDTTRFYIFVPTMETERKVLKLCESLGFEAEILESHCLSVTVAKNQIELFLMAFFGELNGPERANTKLTTTSDHNDIGYEAIARIINADVFINRYKSLWIVDSVENNKYESWFQPIIHAKDYQQTQPRVFGNEALFRIRDESNAVIPPAYVFKVAAHSDLLFSLDLIARRSAIEHAAAANLKSKVFVNFNPASIYDPAYCLRSTAAAIDAAGLKASDVVFEVTETHRVDNMAHLKGILSFYRNAGFQVALDDIGSGWASLNMLNDLMPDYAKIDMDLVRGIHQSDSQQRIVKHLIAGARENGIKVIAEGIETMEEAECLMQFNPDYMQGYLFGKPELKASLSASEQRATA